MRPRNLLLLLGLYILLAWIWAIRSYEKTEVLDRGLLWTAVGIGVVIVLVIGYWLYGAYRSWRAQKAAEPKKEAPAAARVVEHPDDAALRQLFSEARARLHASPEYGKAGRQVRLEDLPLTLVVGPPGAGKTSTILNCGIEPHLLAGHAASESGAIPTQVANIFVKNQELLVEIAGRVWEGDLERWKTFLAGFLPKDSLPWWKRLLREQRVDMPRLRSVVLVEELPGAKGRTEVVEVGKLGQQAQERLQALSEVFHVVAPVYVLFTHTDGIPYYADFFGRMLDAEVPQAVGISTAVMDAEPPTTTTSDMETKRMTKAFGVISFRLADRRVAHLVRESDPTKKPGVYEFPREFRRVRGLVVQFLVAACRPDPLKITHVMRGFYFAGTRQVEVSALSAKTNPGTSSGNSGTTEVFREAPLGATQIFRGEATQIFRSADPATPAKPAGGRVLRQQWMFVQELFENILPGERATMLAAPRPVARIEQYGQLILAGVAGVCALMLLIWLQSWWLNRSQLVDLQTAAERLAVVSHDPGQPPSPEALNRLEALRRRLAALEESPSLWMRWGLYSGDAVKIPARRIYFRKFDQMILDGVNERLASSLTRLPSSPAPTEPSSPAYEYLATHLAISGAACHVDAIATADVLKREAVPARISVEGSTKDLVDRQIDYYANTLVRKEVPVHVAEDAIARDNARAYLKNVMNLRRVYCGVIVEANRKFQPLALSAMLPEYQRTLQLATPDQSNASCGPPALQADQVAGAYSLEAIDFVSKEIQARTRAGLGDPCVMGSSTPSLAGGGTAADTRKELMRMYVTDYKNQWKSFLARFSVVPYGGLSDAARKLEVLANYKSPLLGLLWFTSKETSYTASAAPTTGGKLTDIVGQIPAVKAKADEVQKKLPPKAKEEVSDDSPAAITEAFAPVRSLVPGTASAWKNERNGKYLDSLSELQQGLVEMERAGGRTPDPAANAKALAAWDKARGELRALSAAELSSVGSNGVDEIVRNLLEQPITKAKRLIPDNPDKALAGKMKEDLRGLCSQMSGVLSRYPFHERATSEASLQQIATLLAPQTGQVWQYAQKSLGEYAAYADGKWIQKPEVQKPLLSEELLRFLNRAQTLSNAFYSRPGQLSLRYSLRPQEHAVDQVSVVLDFDGTKATFAKGSTLQRDFTWPAQTGSSAGAIARENSGDVQFPFGQSTGLWGVFRVFGGAEPRAIGEKNVEWKYVRGAGNEPSPLSPPVRLQFVDFPGGLDLFNPRFFADLHCPSADSAVQ